MKKKKVNLEFKPVCLFAVSFFENDANLGLEELGKNISVISAFDNPPKDDQLVDIPNQITVLVICDIEGKAEKELSSLNNKAFSINVDTLKNENDIVDTTTFFNCKIRNIVYPGWDANSDSARSLDVEISFESVLVTHHESE